MAGKSTTISNKAAAIGAISIQQSTYGATIPIMWGRNRLTGNLIWYADFKATPHTEVTQQGGKGGGGQKTSNTTYTYSAAVQMALCRGPISGIRTVWRGKSVYRGGATASSSRSVTEMKVVSGTRTVTASTTTNFVDISVQLVVVDEFDYGYSKPNSKRSTLTQGVDYTVTSAGVYSFPSIAPGATVFITYNCTTNAAGSNALPALGLNLGAGTPGQAAWTYLTSAHPTQAVGYSTIAYVAASNYSLTENAQVDNHAFEVDGPLQFSASIPDSNPADVVQDALNNPIYGAGFGDARLGSMADFRNACTAQGIFLSPVLNSQTTAAEFLAALAKLTNVGLVWSGGVLKFVPYADMPMTGNGVTFTPNTVPIYDLTDDDFRPNGGDPVVVNRGSTADTFNSVKLEYCDRANDYNLAIMPASDDADILENGLRESEVIQAHWITEANVARVVAQLILQRSMFVRNTYEFRLNWTKIGLEAMDLVTLTDAGLGLNKYVVRITEMEEDQDGELSFIAEDFPQGSASATLYPTTTGIGFAHNYNAAPGNANAPTIFEAPTDLTASTSGLEVWLATGSTAPDYGGCEVWVSLDGSNYQRAYVLKGSSRYGVTTSTLAADANPGVSSKSVNVSLMAGGQLMGGSTADRDRLTTLCYAGGEFFAYDSATLTGAGAYRLGPSLNRGAYGSGVASRAAGVPFVRCDEGIAKMTLTGDYIGQTLYVKLLAFNVYQANTQGLADVQAYTYTVTGTQANLAPLAPGGLALEGPFTIDTAKFRWDAAVRASTYNVQVWAGTPAAKVREVNVGDARRFDYSSNDAKTDGGPWRAVQLRVQGVNQNGAPGAFASLSVSNPQVGALTGVRVAPAPGSLAFSCAVPTDPDFEGIQVWLSTSQTFTPGAGNLVYSGPNTSVSIGADTSGAALAPGVAYYLKYGGYDSFDKAGMTIGASDAVTLLQQQLYATVMMYKWSTAKPTPPIGTSIFNWGTGLNGSYNGDDGWFSSVQDNPGTPGMSLWVVTKAITAISGTASSNVTFGGLTVVATGSNTTAGVQTATATVYQWGATIPAGPAGGGVYTWSNGNIGTVPTNWLATPGTAPSLGMTLFAATVKLIDSSSNATTNFNWSTASIMAIGYAPANGAAGASYVTAYCASSTGATTTAPSPTSGLSSVPSPNGGGIVGAWTKAVPVLGTNQYLYQSDGIYDPATGNVTWSIPYWSSLKVAVLSAISANFGAMTAGSIDLGSGSSSWHVDTNGNQWSGAATIGAAPLRIYNTGAMVALNLSLRNSNDVEVVGPTGLKTGFEAPGTKNSDIKIGGRNLYQDSSFERGLHPCTTRSAAVAGVTFAHPNTSTVGAVNGLKSLFIETNGGDAYTYLGNPSCAVVPGRKYMLSYYYRSNGAILGSSTHWQMSNGVHFSFFPPTNVSFESWTRVSMEWTCPAGVTWIDPRFGINCNGYAWLAIDCIQIEEGNILTDWSPAPEDVTADIVAAKAVADASLARLALMGADNKLSKEDKIGTINEFVLAGTGFNDLRDRADALGVSRTAYVNAKIALNDYLLPILGSAYDDASYDSDIDGNEYRAKFAAVYEQKDLLTNALSAKAATAPKLDIAFGSNWFPNSAPGTETGYNFYWGSNAAYPVEAGKVLLAQGAHSYATYSRNGSCVYLHITGTPPNGSTAELWATWTQESWFPVKAGARYQAGVDLSTHRCTSRVVIRWYNASRNIVGSSVGNWIDQQPVNYTTVPFPRSFVFDSAPAGAMYAALYVQMVNSGQAEPFTFASQWLFSDALANQTVPAVWSEGSASNVRALGYAGDMDATKGANWATNLVGKPKQYRVVAAGNNATGLNLSPGFYMDSLSATYTGNPMYTVVVLRRSNGTIANADSFFTLGNSAESARMANFLNGYGSDVVIVVYSADEPRGNRMDGGLPAAMYRCGASSAVFGSPVFRYRAAYILVGIPGCGEGGAVVEAYQGDVDASPASWCDIGFTIDSLGNCVGTGVNTAQALANKLDAAGSSVLRGRIAFDTDGAIVASPSSDPLIFTPGGTRQSGRGTAMTPYGFIAHNGVKYTFVVEASNGHVTIGGTLDAVDGSFSTITFANGGYLKSANAAGFGQWPANQNVVYLSPEGLMLGNFGINRYVQINADGTIYAPGFLLQNGQLTLTSPVIVSPSISGATFDAFTASLSGGPITSNSGGNPRTLGSRQIIGSGGALPYRSFSWTVTVLEGSAATFTTISGENTDTVTASAQGSNATTRTRITGTITDANGRTASASFTTNATFGAA